MKKSAILSVGLLAGTIIGAGIFSLPYIFSKIGFIPSVLYLFVFAGVYISFYFMYSSLLLKEEGKHDFFRLAEKYLPSKFSKWASFIILGELIFALVVYLSLSVSFLEFGFGVSGILPVFAFWLIGSIFLFTKLDWLGIAELIGVFSIVAIVIFILFLGGSTNDFFIIKTFPDSFDWKIMLFPFGPLLFSFSGRPAISKIIEEYKKSKKSGATFSLKNTIILGTILPALVYLFFVLGIFRLGGDISPDALGGLSFLPPLIKTLLGFLGFMALWTSYVMIATNIRDIIVYDVKKIRFIGIIIPLFLPLTLFFLGFNNFIFVLGLVGGIFIALEGIFVVRMWQNAFRAHPMRRPAYVLYIIFLIAAIYEIFNLVFHFQ